MSYREDIKRKIRELEEFIEVAESNKQELTHELNRLKFIEWEEDVNYERNQQLLKG